MKNPRIAMLALMLMFLSFEAIASDTDQRRTLRLSSDVWPPFTDVIGKPRVAIDLVQTALARAGFEANTTTRGGFGDLVEDLRSGAIDGTPALWHSAERAQVVFYSRPYLENRLVLVGRKGSDLSAVSLSLLAGKRVAIVESYAYGKAVEGAKGPEFIKGPSDAENLRRLLRSEVDYVLADELLVQDLFKGYPDESKERLEVGEVPLVERQLHFALRRDFPGAAAIVRRFDAEIRAMILDGSYNRILQLDWIRVDVDGDGVVELVHGDSPAGALPPSSSYELFEMEAPKVPNRERLKLHYVINGHAYDSWEDVPAEYKIPTERDPIPERSGLFLFEF